MCFTIGFKYVKLVKMPAQKRPHINFFGDSKKVIFFKLIKENFDKVI